MSNPNPERDERVRQIRERQQSAETNMRQLGRYNGQDASWADIDYLLSLLDGQAAELVKTKQHRDDLIEELNRRSRLG